MRMGLEGRAIRLPVACIAPEVGMMLLDRYMDCYSPCRGSVLVEKTRSPSSHSRVEATRQAIEACYAPQTRCHRASSLSLVATRVLAVPVAAVLVKSCAGLDSCYS